MAGKSRVMPALVPIRFGSSPEGTPKRPLVSGHANITPPFTPETWNPLDKTAGITLSNSDKTASAVNIAGGIRSLRSHDTGKWYAELTVDTMTGNIFQNDGIGLCIATTPLGGLFENVTAFFIRNNGWFYNGGVFGGALNGLEGHIIGFAYNGDTGLTWVRSEDTDANAWHGTAFGANPATGTFGFPSPFGGGPVFLFTAGDGGTTDVVTINETLVYAPPAGFGQW